MKKIIYIFIFFTFIKFVSADKIIFGVSGIAKVGNNCFLSLLIKDKSKSKINKIEFSIFTTNENMKLLGNSKIVLSKINKHQPYTTSIPISMSDTNLCNEIRNINVIANKCSIKGGGEEQCKSLIKADKSSSNGILLKTIILKDLSFFNSKNLEYFVKELNIFLNIINLEFAKKYNIKNNTFGLIVTNANKSDIFKNGDLIIEAEMNEIKNFNELKKQLGNIFKSEKKNILINLIRNNNEKMIAVKLK